MSSFPRNSVVFLGDDNILRVHEYSSMAGLTRAQSPSLSWAIPRIERDGGVETQGMFPAGVANETRLSVDEVLPSSCTCHICRWSVAVRAPASGIKLNGLITQVPRYLPTIQGSKQRGLQWPVRPLPQPTASTD